MIQCKDCGFSVNELMRFALMKNVCPSCGSNLLTGTDANIISVIQSRLASQRFSSSLTENQLYDISLFIFNELKHEFGQFALDLRGSKTPQKRKKISESEESEFLESEEQEYEESDFDPESIRREVASEFLEDIAPQATDDDEDVNSKAERLKRLYQQRAVSSVTEASPKIKRGGGFKGVTRST